MLSFNIPALFPESAPAVSPEPPASPRPMGIPALVLWGLALAMAVRLTLLIRQRPFGEFTTIDSMAMLQIAIAFASGLAVVLLWRSIPSRGVFGSPLLFLLAYYAFGLASVLWSPLPLYSFFRAAEVMSQILIIGMAVSLAPDLETAERRVLGAGCLVMFLQVASDLRLQAGFRNYMDLSTWHSNSFPVTGAMLTAYAYGELGRDARGARRVRLAVTCALGLAAVIMGTSSASNVALLSGLSIGALMSGRIGFLVFFGSALVMLHGLEQGRLMEILFPGKTMDKVVSMQGRVHLWQSYIGQIREHPVVGEGFAVSARLGRIYVTNTHNSILSALLGTGIAGTAFFAGFILRTAAAAVRGWRLRAPGVVGAAGALAAGLINSMSKAFLGEGWNSCTLPFVALLALLSFALARAEHENSGSGPAGS